MMASGYRRWETLCRAAFHRGRRKMAPSERGPTERFCKAKDGGGWFKAESELS